MKNVNSITIILSVILLAVSACKKNDTTSPAGNSGNAAVAAYGQYKLADTTYFPAHDGIDFTQRVVGFTDSTYAEGGVSITFEYVTLPPPAGSYTIGYFSPSQPFVDISVSRLGKSYTSNNCPQVLTVTAGNDGKLNITIPNINLYGGTVNDSGTIHYIDTIQFSGNLVY